MIEFLKLETGQKLRVLSLFDDKIIDTHAYYWDKHIKRYFIYSVFIKKLRPIKRHHILVEYNGELKLIKIGRKIYTLLTDTLNYNYTINDLIKRPLYLNIMVKMTMEFPNYEDSYIELENFDEEIDYFNTSEYKNLINIYTSYITKLQLKNNMFMIEYLNILGYIKHDDTLMRLLKINKLRIKNL